MEIMKIKESGSHNTLLWAIKNGAKIKDDLQIQSIINGEMCYLVTLKNLNFLEMFRLSQMYREKLRIVSVENASIPPRTEMVNRFPGKLKGEDGNETDTLIGVLMEHAATAFYNIALQMIGDEDIIQPGTSTMYLPMIAFHYDVQIPVDFVDFVGSMSPEECDRLFTADYPNNLDSIIEAEVHGVKTILSLGFVKSTAMIRYHERYEKYLNRLKYSPLARYQGDSLYRVALLGFKKYNPILRSELTANMFQSTPADLQEIMKQMAGINTPLKLEVAVQMPIQQMFLIYSGYSREELPIYGDSSIADILDTGIAFSHFVTPPSEDDEKHEAVVNGIEAYKTRIAEANQMTVNAMNLAINSDGDTDITGAFAMLPSAYGAKMVMTMDMSKEHIFTCHTDPYVNAMFKEVTQMGNSINADILKLK